MTPAAATQSSDDRTRTARCGDLAPTGYGSASTTLHPVNSRPAAVCKRHPITAIWPWPGLRRWHLS